MKLMNAVKLFLHTYDNPHTKKTYRRTVGDFAKFVGENRPVASLSYDHVMEFDDDLKTRGYAPATLNQRRKNMKTFLAWLIDMRYIDTNLGRIIKTKRQPRRISRDKAMSDDEFRLLHDYFEREANRQYHNLGKRKRWNHIRNYAQFLFIADTGCRIGGSASLIHDKLDLLKREALLIEKGEKPHRVTFGHATVIALRRWLLARPICDHDHVFVVQSPKSTEINPIHPDTISEEMRRACARLREEGVKIRTLSGHSLRHRKGHQLADAGVQPTIAATALGHESVMTTLEHYYPDDWETAREELQKLVEKPKIARFPKFGRGD